MPASRHEQEAAVAFQARHAQQAFRLDEVGAVAAGVAPLGHQARPARQVEDPAVVRAPHFLHDALRLAQQRRAAVHASVEEGADLPFLVADHDDGLAPGVGGLETAGRRKLGFVSDVDPGPLEDVRHLQLEDVLVRVCLGANQELLPGYLADVVPNIDLWCPAHACL